MKTHYRIVGPHRHSAIKPCHWMEQRLLTGRDNRNCYKGYFGIQSHRCLQNTPSLPFCNQSCVFCWRDIEQGTLGSEFLATPDDPADLVGEMIRHQQNLLDHHLTLEKQLTNFEVCNAVADCMRDRQARTIAQISEKTQSSIRQATKAVKLLKNTRVLKATKDLKHLTLHRVATEMLENGAEMREILETLVTTEQEIKRAHAEARVPGHAAISLGGEPIFYPHISEFVAEFRQRNMTTFIVTNGTRPDILQNLDSLPTQLYISLPAPSQEDYVKICRPVRADQWDSIMATLDLLQSLSCRTCVRLTVLKGLNMDDADRYAELIARANPDFVDVKSFTPEASAGRIGNRLQTGENVMSFVPTFGEMKVFAQQLSDAGSFPILEKVMRSRDILLGCNWPEGKSLLIQAP